MQTSTEEWGLPKWRNIGRSSIYQILSSAKYSHATQVRDAWDAWDAGSPKIRYPCLGSFCWWTIILVGPSVQTGFREVIFVYLLLSLMMLWGLISEFIPDDSGKAVCSLARPPLLTTDTQSRTFYEYCSFFVFWALLAIGGSNRKCS